MSLLFQNEEIRSGYNYPSLTRFFPAKSDKPLVVFSPGWGFLGRISYGIPVQNQKNFLAYWVNKNGYPFLSVSYPLDHPVYEDVYPGFTLNDWGKMTAEITNQIIEENELRREVIGINWSSSGQVVRHFNVFCKSLGINLLFDLGIEATPALAISSDRTLGIKKTEKDMVTLKNSHYELYWNEIKDQSEINGEEIISKEEYHKYFFGDIPIGLMGTNELFINGRIVTDHKMSYEDKKFYEFNEYPLVASISGNSSIAPYHPVVDKSTWSFLVIRKIYHDYFVKAQSSGFNFRNEDIKTFIDYINDLPDRLHKSINGNHLLFIGQKGASEVAEYIDYFYSEITLIKTEIAEFLGLSVDQASI